MVLQDRKAQLVEAAGLREPAQAVVPAQPVHRRLFHNGLTVGHGVQLAAEAVALDRKGAVLGNQLLQGDGFYGLIQVLKAVDVGTAQQNHHPLAHAAVEIGPGDGLGAAGEEHAPVLHPHLLHAQAAQLVAHQTLQPEQAGNT